MKVEILRYHPSASAIDPPRICDLTPRLRGGLSKKGRSSAEARRFGARPLPLSQCHERARATCQNRLRQRAAFILLDA